MKNSICSACGRKHRWEAAGIWSAIPVTLPPEDVPSIDLALPELALPETATDETTAGEMPWPKVA